MSAATLIDRTADLGRLAAVGGEGLAERLGDRLALAAERRARQLRDDGEEGARAAESAVLEWAVDLACSGGLT